MTQEILVVEDEADVRDLVVLHLKRMGHSVTAVSSVEEARGAIAARQSLKEFDMAVVDWMLPGASGVELVRDLRKLSESRMQSQSAGSNDIAVLMLTAKSEPEDIVEGLEAGADDYLTKPFDPSVLIARVKALARRLKAPPELRVGESAGPGGTELSGILKLGPLSLNTDTYEVKCGADPISLTPSEFKLLTALAKSQGRVLTRDSLISQVQGDGVSVVGRTVDTHVFGLRKKLGACSEVIETVRGVGYRVRGDLEA